MNRYQPPSAAYKAVSEKPLTSDVNSYGLISARDESHKWHYRREVGGLTPAQLRQQNQSLVVCRHSRRGNFQLILLEIVRFKCGCLLRPPRDRLERYSTPGWAAALSDSAVRRACGGLSHLAQSNGSS
jgi:hypothetical protein